MPREKHLVAWFALALGCAAVVIGIAILFFNGSGPVEGGTGCKAICGLALLSGELLGDSAGRIVGGLLWICAGAAACLFGWRARSNS